MMEIRKLAILGSGRLGRGIAENAASKGYDVILLSQGAGTQDAPKKLEASLDKKLAKWSITESEKRVILSRITCTSDLSELKKADLVVEATVDHFYTKQELLRTADRLCRPDVVFISTSATLSVSELCHGISRSQALVGIHFIPPVPAINVVELTKDADTDPKAVEVAVNFAKKLGKTVYCFEESPGLVNPRALLILVNEAAYMVAEGIGSAEAVEAVIKGGWTMDQGPLEMADRLGLDIILNWMDQLQRDLGPRFAPCPLIRRHVRQGRLGLKSGKGFLTYGQDENVKAGTEGDLQ